MLHEEGHTFVAEEGAYSASTSNLPVLQYFPARGRAEPIRLALAYAQQEWFEPPVAPILQLLRRQLDGYTFRQLPRYIDAPNGKIDIVQSMAILRHVARKHGLYGGDEEDAARVDMVVDGVQDLRAKLKAYWFQRDAPGAADDYISTVLAREDDLAAPGCPLKGPGLACLERLAADGAEDGPWLGGCPKLTIADITVFDLFDSHLAAAPPVAAAARERFPWLAAHHRRVAAQLGIKEYLASDNRHAHIFADDWRREQQQRQEREQREGG
ncbi:MAG: hypothetical protein J3K34DRAFT_418797 [Monoraphidium minutum]|nr:MAG: hypothetical protein J3K34DRAFT_418797 [Monoraphidium minutum]